MMSLIMAILVIGIPLTVYVVCTAKRPEVFPEEYAQEFVGSDSGEDFIEDEIPQISLDTTMGRIITMEKDMGDFLLKNGLHCVSCSASKNETLAMACSVHGLNAETMKEKIQNYLNENYEV